MTTIPEQLISEGYIQLSEDILDKSRDFVGSIAQWLYFYNPEKDSLYTVYEIVTKKDGETTIFYEDYKKTVKLFNCQGSIIKADKIGEYAFIYGWTKVGQRMLYERLKFLGIKSRVYNTEKTLAAVPNEFLVIDEADLSIFAFYFNNLIRELPLQ
jgi:hypothetical protein